MKDDSETRKWILKQGEYRRLYSSLLQKHRGALVRQSHNNNNNNNNNNNSNSSSEEDEFAEESRMLREIFRKESMNLLWGAGAAVVTLVSLRFVRSKHAVTTVFGKTKAEAMHHAEAEGKKRGTHGVQKSFANVVEGCFSLWVGMRCYDSISHASFSSAGETSRPETSIDAIASLPLCRGRSRVAEALCPEWIDITRHQIPAAYWRALDQRGTLNDERTWQALRTFSFHCERRMLAENAVRRARSLPDSEPVFLPARVDEIAGAETR